MGQRLVIDIEMNGKTLAKVYYHWSGYTSNAIAECIRLINDWKEKKGTLEPAEMTLFKIIRSYGGGIFQNNLLDGEVNHLEALNSGLSIGETKGDRDNGMIAFTKEGMKYHDYWADETATIYLDRKEPTFEISGAFNGAYEEDYADFEKCKAKALEYNIFDEFTVEEADNFLELVVRTDFFLCKHDYWLPVRE